MLLLMNGARVGVGFECIGLCEAALRLARATPRERARWARPSTDHEMIADYLDEMRTDLPGLRALAAYGAFHEEMAQKIAAQAPSTALFPTEAERASRRPSKGRSTEALSGA
jgi:alkylation response protein AidB-like acyl-CoA dehydrogenase